MNTRTFLKTLFLVPLGAVVEKLPGQGVATVMEMNGCKEVTSFSVKEKVEQINRIYAVDPAYGGGERMLVIRRRFEGWGNDAIGKAS